jgi:hypothetical protein
VWCLFWLVLMSFPTFQTQLAPQQISSSLGASTEIQGPECALCLGLKALCNVHCKTGCARTGARSRRAPLFQQANRRVGGGEGRFLFVIE